MLKSRMSIAALMLVVLVVLMGGGYAIAQTMQRNSPTTQIKNSWELTKLSGHYSFRTEVNQYTNPEPRISNYGATASHMHYRIEGNTDESTQTTEILITNITADGESKIAIRRVRGHTYVMQPDLTWQEAKTSTAPSQLGSLSYLAGMSTATRVDANSYNFAYDGSAYVANMQRLLNIDANHGIRYEDSFTEITRSQQAIETTGKGELHTDGDGLPATLVLNLTMPPNNREVAKRLMIQTTFFGYARTGLVLQAAIHDPIHQLSRLLGANAAQVQSWFFAAMALLALCVSVVLVQLFGRRMYFPITVIVIAMTIYQPYATIPASKAATNSTTQPTPVPAAEVNQTPPKPFNPLISPLAQPMGIALPAAGTSSPDMTTIATNQRGVELGTSTDCKALTDADRTTDTDGDGLTNAQECQYHTILNNKDSDADTLTDLQEIRLGTDPNIIDTDGDGISDFVEVTIPTVINGQSFYTSPFEKDTNNDGLQDGLECPQHLNGVIDLNSPQNCTVTTGNVPDFLSFDNDVDSVPDSVDKMPYQWSGATAYTSAQPFKYSVTGAQGVTQSVPLTLDMQIRPKNPEFLYANGAVYEWPLGDNAGQIQHTFNTTFKDPKDPIYKSTSDNAANGNMRVTAVLEIRVPINQTGNTFGGLPVYPGCENSTALFVNDNSLNAKCQQGSETIKGDMKPAWLDVAKMAKYNMTASWGRKADGTVDNKLLVLNVPLFPVYNSSKSIVAYNATAMYEPALNQVISGQEARLQWIVTSLQDQCQIDVNGRCNDALPRKEFVGNVQTYYDDFVITGLQASELLGETDAVFYEDASKPTALNTARRLHIARLAGFLGEHFVDSPDYKMERDTNCQASQATCTSITDIFNQNTSMGPQYVHGIDTSVIKNKIFKYTDSLDATKLYISDIHTLIDGMIPAAARTTCGASTAPNCRPGVVVASEMKKRYSNAITLSATATNAITIDSAVSVARASRGAIWRYDTTYAKWMMIDAGDYDVEKNSIMQGMNLSDTTSKPATVDVNTWRKWLAIIPQSAIVNLQRNFTMVYDQATLTTAATVVRSDATVWNNWDTFTRTAVILLQPIVQYIVDTAPYNPQSPLYKSGFKANEYMAVKLNRQSKYGETRAILISTTGIAIGAGAIILSTLIITAVLFSQSGALNTVGVGVVADTRMMPIFLTKSLVEDVSTLRNTVEKIVAISVGVGRLVNILRNTYQLTVQLKMLRDVGAVGPASYVLAALNVGKSIAMGIMNILSAKYEFQRLNAGFTMVGEIAATAVMLAIQIAIGTTGVGLVVLAVLGVIDSIASITCSYLSAKARRSSTAQWLCGGITGLLTNFLTLYKASVAVDRDDPYSYQQDIKPSIVLENPVQGYVKDNQANFKLKITDYIEKMPFPAAWQSAFYAWQWINLDERSSAFDYKLDSIDYNLSGGLSINSQTWSENPDRSTYDLPYMKSKDLTRSLSFATTGINQPMPGMRLSMGWKVRQQTCFTVPFIIPILWIPIPIPVCYMGEFAQDEHKEITRASDVIYDIMPTTFAKFMETKQGSRVGMSTFAWNSDSSAFKFPDFKDADNDGVLATAEIINGTSDKNYDTDSDGVDDKAEITFGTDANKKDTDGDGLSDLEEIQYGTDPKNKDTDGDGLLDSEEIVRSVNGVRVGGWEVTYDIVNGVPLKTWMSSDPLNADADKDNLIDLRERILGTSPYAANNANVLSMSDTKLNEALNPRVLLDFEQGMLGAKGGVAGGNATSTFSCGALGCPKAVADVVNGRTTTVADFGTTGNGLFLNLGTQQISPTFSAAFWVKPVLQATAVSQLLQIGNVIIYRSNSTKGICVSVSSICSIVGVPDNQWTHVSLVSDGKFIKIYINGVQIQIHTPIGSSIPLKNITSGVMSMGCDGCIDQNRFYGSMDDVALFNTALTTREVDQLRLGTLSNRGDNVVRPGDRVTLQASLKNELLGRSLQGYTTFSSQSANTNVATNGDYVPFAMAANAATTSQNTLTVPGIVDPAQTGATRYFTQGCQYTGAILCLKLDEPNTSTTKKVFTDISTNNYVIECTNGNGGTQVTCPQYNGDSWEFGQNSDFSRLNVPTLVVQQLDNTDFTIGLRFRFTGTASLSRRTLVSNDNGTFRLGLTNNMPSISMPGMADIVAKAALSNNTWYQLTYRVAKSIATIYVNGIAVVQGPANVLLANFSGYSFTGAYYTDYIPTFTGTRSPSNVSALYVGSDNSQNLNATGAIRDVQFYNTALSDYQIQAWGQGCDDALLIVCVNPSGNDGAIDQDASLFGGTEQVKLTRASWSPNPIFQGTAALVVGEPATIQKNLPNGYESLLNQQDFTIVSKIQVPSNCAYLPILTSTIGGTRLGLDGSCRPRLMLYTDPNVAAVISRALTPGLAVLSLTMMPKLKQYRITLYQSGNAPMSAALNDPALHLQDPVTIHSALVGQSPYLVNFRIYKTVLDDANISAIASSLLGSQGTSASGVTPRSDVLTFNAEARVKVVQSDADFEHDYTAGATTQLQLAFDEPVLSSRFIDLIHMPRTDNIAVTCDPSTCPQSGVPGVTGNALWFNSAPKNERIIENNSLNSAIAGEGQWIAIRCTFRCGGIQWFYTSVCEYPYNPEVNFFRNTYFPGGMFGWNWIEGYGVVGYGNPPAAPAQPYLNCYRRSRSYAMDNAQWLNLPTDNQFMKFLTGGTPADQSQVPAKFDFWIKPTAYGGRIIDHKLMEIGLDANGHITVKHAVNQEFRAVRNYTWTCNNPFIDYGSNFLNMITGNWFYKANQYCAAVYDSNYNWFGNPYNGNRYYRSIDVADPAYRRYDWPSTALTSPAVVPLGQWSRITVQTDSLGESIAVNGGALQWRNLASNPAELTHIYEEQNDPIGDLKIGYGYSGYLDNLTVSKVIDNVVAPTPSKPLTVEPNWALDFEDYNVQQTRRPDNSIAVLGTLVTPKSNQARNGIARYSVAATCIGVFSGSTCPLFGVAGQNGLAASFNGTTSILEVKNPNSIISAMPNNVGGTMQIALHPKATGTVFYYGTPSGDIGLKVEINSELKLQITAKDNAATPTTFTTNSPLPKTWNVLSLSWGNGTLKYYLNGVDNTSTLDKSSSFNVLPNASYRIFIGGRIDASGNAANLFTGDIDDISITPGSLPGYYHFASARMQYAQSMVNTAMGSVTVDADNPVVTVTTPEYAPGTGQMFQISASDATSAISRVDTTIRPLANGSALNITTPVCSDTINDKADPKKATYCPFLPNNSEGQYDVVTTVYDAVNNRGLSQASAIGSGTVFIDTTAPTATLLLPTMLIAGTPTTVPYTTTSQVGSNTQLLRLRIDVRDPVLKNSGNHAGSGVKEVAMTLKNVNGATIVKSTPATVVNGAWQSDLAIPLANPNGFYLVDATIKDQMGNQTTLALAGTANPIEIDSAAPHDVIVSPSPLTANLYLVGPSNLTSNSITGRVSDLYDGRAALQRGLRVKLDFESNDGAKEFDNRANTRYVSDCSTCPTVAYDMTNGQRIARFNIEGTNQYISVHHATGAIDNVFSIALQFKINDSGTLLSSGIASNPRIRVKATQMLNGTGYTVSVYRGNKTISTPPLVKNVWYNLIYTEADHKMGLQVGTSYTAMLPLVETAFVDADTPAEADDLLIGAIRSGVNSAAVEDPFRGYIDNIMVSSNFLTPSDLIGKDVANGSGTTQHQTRLAVRDDGFAENDNLAPVTDYFVPFNQSALPVVDVMNALKSALCNGALTAPGISCPTIVAGFTSNAMQFGKETDGVRMGYAITQTQNAGKTYSLRVKISTGSQSGRLLTIAPNGNGVAVRVAMNYNAITQQVSTTISDTAAVATVLPMTILDDQWHTVSLVTNALTTTTTVAAYLDNAQVGNAATIQGLLQNANLNLGAVPQILAAKGAIIDDVGVFTTAFNMNQLRSLVFGNGPVYFETFDMIDTSADSTRPDDSLFAQPSNYRNTQATPGLVGSGALNSGATTVVNHIDSRGLSWVNPNEPWSISTWLQFNSTSSSGVIARNREGSAPGANGAFVLEKIGAKLKFSHWNQSITTGDVITQTTTPMHVVMNSDGQTMALWVNGQSMVTGTVATGGNNAITNNVAKLVQTGQSPTASSTATGSNRDNAADNDATTVFTTNSETNPWWQYTLGTNPVRIDQIIIRNIPNSATALRRLHVIVSNDANTNFSTADSSAVWHTVVLGTLGAITVLQLPYGTMGRFVRVQIEGQNQILALPGIEINQALVLNLNSTTTSIDDFRLYRHDLTPINISTLEAMSWRASTLTARQDGYSWQRQLPNGLEVDAKIQSTTTDRNGNTRVGIGEQTLWGGRIDTRAPRVDAREIPIANTNLYSYTVQIDERNLNVNLLQTPCGSRFDEKLSVAPSLWYRVRSSAFDGSFIESTHLDGACVYGDTPDVVQQLAQPISTTKSIVFGSRYAYAGGVNTVSVIDTQNTVNLVQNSAPVVGTVMQLLMSRNKNRLYALSTSNTPTNRAIITIFDIPTNNSTLTLRGSVAVPLAPGATLQDGALTSYYDASVYTDNFLQLLVNSTPQQIISVQVSNPDQPTQITSTSLDTTVTSYDMDASYDIVALAQGIGGVAFWQVNPNGTMQYKSSYRTGGYLNRVIFKDMTAIVLDDDEPYTNGTQPTSPNTMRIVPVISSITAGQANLVNPIVAQSNYVHIVPTAGDDVAPYRILDVTPYLGGDVVALSADSSNANRFRLSMISTDTSTPTLRSDTLITNANVKRVVSSNNSILTMANSGQASQLQAFVVTDRRLATRLCDQAGNCTVQSPRSRNTLRLSRTAPAQGSVQIINVTNAYTTTTQSLTFHAEAPSGVQTIQMKIDGNAPQTVWTAPSGDPLTAVEAATTLTGLSQKSHTVQGINNFNNLLTAKTQYYAPITQAILPITDVLHAVGSDRCSAGNTAPGITCPAIVSGFAGNALQLGRATDGIRMGYAITQTTALTQSVSLRIKIPSNSVSGRIASIAPLTGSDPTLKLWFDYNSAGNLVNTSLVDTSGITQTSTVAIPDTAWHLLTVVSGVVSDTSTVMIYLDGALVDSIAGQGRFTNAALVLGATPLTNAATNVMVDDIAVFSDALTTDNLQYMLAGDVITPNQTVTPVYTFFVDNVSPQITLIDKFIGFNRVIDGIITARLVITDVSDLVSLQTINRMTGSQIGNSYTRVGDVTNVSVFYPEAIVQGTTGVMTPTLPLSIITTDSAQHTSTLNTAIQIDNDPPVVVSGVTNAAVNGVITPITANTPVTRTNDLDLHVGWTQLRDLVSVPLKTLEYTVQTITDTQSLTTSVTLGNRSPAMLTREGSRIVPSLRLRDSIGNEGVTALPVVYVDSAVTPDYTQIGTTNEIYRGWLGNGCAALGESATKGMQRFATTWDSQNLRINWQGANWNIDGDLFIYLDSIDGGTVQPYRPSKYTQTLTDSVALGDAFVTLPVNMAGRSIGLSSSAASWTTRLLNAQQQPRATTIQGADYVIYVQSNNTITLLRWDSGSSSWVRQSTLPEFRYDIQNNINQTDLRIPFSQISYTIGQPFGMVAFASAKTALLPWAVFPTTNPTRLDRGTAKIVLTPLLNGYSWSTLGDGVCPRKDAANPDTTQVVSSLTSTPSGSYQSTITGNFKNTDPDAIANAIMQTQAMCALLTSDSWCKTVSQLADTTTAGSAILAGFANTLVSQQTPVVGDNSVVTYTLQIQNTSNRPTRPLYGIVRTYGGIWLTGTVNAGATTGIISGNVYDYHTVTNSNFYDYQVVKIDRIPANSSQSVTLRAKIDPRKAQPSESDRFSTSTVAKIEVRITDDSSATALNSTARTIEWLNAGIRIDTQAPTLIRADNQQVVRTGNVVLTGSVQDDSAVPNVQLEYRFDSGTTTAIGCGAAVAGQWRCAIAVPSTATTMNYRMRASDTYNQLSPWSAWYSAQIDRDKPTFKLDAASTSLLVAPYVGGQTIQISGLLSDTMSTADMMVCDEQQANCTIAPTTSQIRPTTTYTTTVATTMAIAAQPCATTDLEGYTRYPITVTGVGTSRIGGLTVNTSIAHGAANEVDVWLESPSGTRVALLNSERGAGVDIRATFADTAVASSTTLTGTTALGATYKLVKPDGSLANFGGQPGNGTWTLLACDRTSNGTNGNILGAELVMTSATIAQSVSAPWTYTLANTANQDNVTRRIQFWAKDAAGNVSNAQNTTVRIDTVAPGMTVFQNAVTVLPSTASVPFQGTISDGGQIQSLTANVYAGTSQVATIALTPIEATSNEVKRLNYLLNRALRTYTWNMPLDTTAYAPGTYQVQFVVRDAVGNLRRSDAYTINVPVKTLPSMRDIQVTGSLNANEQTIRYKLDTGYAVTAVNAQIALDSSITTPYTGTVVQAWKDNGTSDTTLQTAIPAAIQTKQITKLDMNNDFAAALDHDGVLYTWPIDTDPIHRLTSNEIAGTTPITNVVQFSIAEQYAWDNYLLTLDRAGRVTEYNRPVGASHVVKTIVPTTTYENGKVIGVDAGYRHNVALLSTGKVIAWWHDVCDDLDNPDTNPTPAYCDPSSPNYPITIPAKAQYGVAQVQAGVDFSVALRNDGTVVAWGSPVNNHLAIPSTIQTVTQIAVGAEHVVALQEDGTVVAWGDDSAGQTTVPEGLSDVIFVAAGAASSAAVTRSGKVVVWGETDFVKQGGASAVALNYSYCTPVDQCGTDLVHTGQSPTASSVTQGSNVDYVTDNNSATSFISNLETNPWWQYPLGATSVPVNQIVINSSRISLSPTTKLHVMVSDNPNTTFSSTDWNWHYVTDTVAVNMVLDLPPGITGKYVRLQLEGTNEVLSLSGIEINQTNGNHDVPAQVITVNQTATQTTSQQVNAAVSFNTGTAVFTGVIPGRRYRYTLTATNMQGTQTYTGTFTSNQTFNRLYTPLLYNSSPAAPPASSGR